MPSDIVERLAEHADQAHECGSLGWRDTMNEAADTITTLRAEVAMWKEAARNADAQSEALRMSNQEFYVNLYEDHDPAVFGTRTKADYAAGLVAEWGGPKRKALIRVRYCEDGSVSAGLVPPTQEPPHDR